MIPLWEESPEVFLRSLGLLQLAMLTRSDEPTERLWEIAEVLDKIEDRFF